MTGGAVENVGMVDRKVLGAEGVGRAASSVPERSIEEALQVTAMPEGHKAAQGSLAIAGGRRQQDARSGSVRSPDVDPLTDARGGIAAFDGDLSDEEVAEGVYQQISRNGESRDGIAISVAAPLHERSAQCLDAGMIMDAFGPHGDGAAFALIGGRLSVVREGELNHPATTR
jgi:hypothetical protein